MSPEDHGDDALGGHHRSCVEETNRGSVADYPDELWRSVADRSGMLLSEENQETTLRRVSDLAVRSIANCDAVEQRWSRCYGHAAERGVYSSLSFPLMVRGQALGALNLYARELGHST